MRRGVVRFALRPRLHNAKASLGDQGKLSAKLTEGIRTLQVAERHPMARQNVRLLIPSVTASPCHRLAAARSRRGSDSPPGCHSTPRRRFATLVTKGRLGLSKQAKTPAFAGASQTFYIPKYSRFALLLAMAYHTSTASTTPSSARLCHRFINGVSSTELLSTCKMP